MSAITSTASIPPTAERGAPTRQQPRQSTAEAHNVSSQNDSAFYEDCTDEENEDADLSKEGRSKEGLVLNRDVDFSSPTFSRVFCPKDGSSCFEENSSLRRSHSSASPPSCSLDLSEAQEGNKKKSAKAASEIDPTVVVVDPNDSDSEKYDPPCANEPSTSFLQNRWVKEEALPQAHPLSGKRESKKHTGSSVQKRARINSPAKGGISSSQYSAKMDFDASALAQMVTFMNAMNSRTVGQNASCSINDSFVNDNEDNGLYQMCLEALGRIPSNFNPLIASLFKDSGICGSTSVDASQQLVEALSMLLGAASAIDPQSTSFPSWPSTIEQQKTASDTSPNQCQSKEARRKKNETKRVPADQGQPFPIIPQTSSNASIPQVALSLLDTEGNIYDLVSQYFMMNASEALNSQGPSAAAAIGGEMLNTGQNPLNAPSQKDWNCPKAQPKPNASWIPQELLFEHSTSNSSPVTSKTTLSKGDSAASMEITEEPISEKSKEDEDPILTERRKKKKRPRTTSNKTNVSAAPTMHKTVLASRAMKVSTIASNVANSRPCSGMELLDLEDLEDFASYFKKQRIKHSFTQGDVGMALGKRYGTDFSQTTISRFEALNLSYKNMCKLRPLLKEWLEETEILIENGATVTDILETPAELLTHSPFQSQQNGDNQLGDPDASTSSSGRPFLSGSSSLIGQLKKRRKRTNLDNAQKASLDTYFNDNCRPDHHRMNEIASSLDLDPDVVRVWFCNRRQKLRKT